MNSPRNLRRMQKQDIACVMKIQEESYVEIMRELEVVIRKRFLVAPETAWVVERDGIVCAYLIAYKSMPGVVSAWGSEFYHKADARTFYIHDIALDREARGMRMGQWLVEQVLSQARILGMDSAALVAVQSSQVFWRKMGFETCAELAPSQQENLNTYAGNAFYMMRSLV